MLMKDFKEPDPVVGKSKECHNNDEKEEEREEEMLGKEIGREQRRRRGGVRLSSNE